MRQRQERAHGPYKHGARWRVVIIGADGSRAYPRESEGGPAGFASREAAQAYIDAFRDEAADRTIGGAVDAYLAHCRERGLKSVTTLWYRLKGLLRLAERDRPMRQLTPRVAAELLEQRRSKVSTDTQVGELAAARGFAAWCIERGWLAADPFAKLEAEGQRARGKAQLRIAEARRFAEVALAEGGEAGIAAAMALLLDLRASEIIGRTVRDVDDGASVLWVERAKTRHGDRRLEIPAWLRDPLAALCAGRGGGEPLFPRRSRHWVGYHVRRLCRAAGVPVVCPHGLRGTWASISVRELPTEQVAAALGHASPAVTRRHYLAAGAEQEGRQRVALQVIAGGRR